MQPQAFVADWRDRLAYPDERARPAPFAWECLRRSVRYAEAFAHRERGAAARFGVERIVDPWGNEPPRFLRTCAAVRGSWNPPRRGELAGMLWVAFDPALPSDPQIASAARWVRARLAVAHRADPEERRRMRIPPPRSIVLALRVHDARATSAPWCDIVERLFIGEQERYRARVTGKRLVAARRQADRLLKVACRLIDGGYLELALRDEYRPGDDDLAPPRFARPRFSGGIRSMSQLGRLVISLEASTAQFTAAMTKAEAQATASMDAIATTAKVATGFLGGLAGAFSLSAVMDWGKGVISAASALDDLADVTGSSVENLSKLKNQAEIGGMAFDQLETLVAKLAAGMAGADDESTKVGHALAALGVEAKDPAEALQEIAVKLSKYTDGINKAALAKDLFGPKAIQFLAQLKDIAAMQDVASTVTAQQAAESEKLEQALRRIGVESTTLKNALLSDLVPALNGIIDRFRLARKEGESFFSAFVYSTQSMEYVVPTITKVGQEIERLQKKLAFMEGSPAFSSSGAIQRTQQELAEALKQYKILSDMRDQWIAGKQQFSYTGDSRDQRAQNSAASISKDVLAYESLGKAVTKAKESTYDFEKELERLYNQLDNTASGINDEFLTKLYMLQGVYEAGDMSLEQYTARVEALIKSTKFGADAIAKMEEAAKANNKAFDDAYEAIEKARIATENSIKSARLMVEQMEFENTTIGMTNAQREIAIGLRALELQGVEKGSEAYQLFAQRITAAVEAKEGLQAQIQLWKDIQDAATNAIDTILTRGMSGFRDLWENFKAWAIRAIAQVAAQRIVVPIVGQVLGIGGAGASTGLGSGGGGIFDSILGALGGGFGNSFSALSMGFADFTQLLGQGVGVFDAFSTAASAAGLGLSSMVPVIGAVVAAGTLLYQWIESKGGGPKSGGFATSGPTPGIFGTDNNGRWFTPNSSDSDLLTSVKGLQAQYDALIKALGGKGGGAFAIGFDTDPNGTAPNRLHAGAWVNGRQIFNSALGDLGRDADALKAALDLESKRALLAAIQASELPDDIAAIIDSLNASTATEEMIGRALDFAGAVHELGLVLERNPLADAMDAVAIASEGSYAALQRSGQAIRDMVADFDGSTDATKNLTAATAAYYQQQVRLLVQIEQVRQAVEAMFGDTIRSLTLTTLDDPGKYNFLRSEADSLMQQLLNEKDPAKIQALAQRINQDLLDAFGLLDPEQQRQFLAEYTTYAQSVSEAVANRLSQIGDDARATVNDVLSLVKDAFQAAVDDFVNAAGTQQTAADTQLEASRTPLVIDIHLPTSAAAVNA